MTTDPTLGDELIIGTELGSGCFGTVYLAQDHVLGHVAVKVMTQLVGEDENEWHKRKLDLVEEGRRLRDADHQNIVRVFRVRESPDGQSVHLVMEYCQGGSVNSIYETGPANLSLLHGIVFDAALGLQALHARGMLHRDIKPRNLLLGQNGETKLGDFGLVTNDLVLGYGDAEGYVDHLAPEVFAQRTTSVRTDIWALGLTLYRLLHGCAYFDELPPPGNSVQCGGFASRLTWLPHVPPSWRRFVRHMLHDDPNMRVQDAGEVLHCIESLVRYPDWTCSYSKTRVMWQREDSRRRIVVVWERISPRKNRWNAVSYPVGEGRSRRLAGSSGEVGKSKVIRELEEFFRGHDRSRNT